MVFEVPEIVSISASNVRLLFPWARTTKRWLVIEPANALREEVSNRLRSAGCGGMLCGPETEALVADEDGRLAIEWRLYRPALRRFMNEVKREWPSLTVTQERRREVDLIAIWNEPEPYRRQVLAEAKRYGLGAACVFLVMSKRHVSFSQAAAYMAALGGRPAGEEPFASVPAAQPGEVWAATPSSGREPQVSRPSGCAQRDLCPKWAISLVMGVVLAADFALLGHDLKSRILVQAAGLLWLAVLWLPATKRPVGVRQIASLIVFAALAVIVREHPGAAIIADFWSLLVLVTGFGELLLSRPPGTTRWRPLHVTARGLCGAIEHGNTYVSPTVVQEFSAGWEIELSSVTTDRSGHFDLQQVAPAPVHYLAVSHPGMETQYLEVTLTQDAMPLLVRLRPRSG